MAKSAFPSTIIQPVQNLDFILKDGQMIRAEFLPQPDQSGSRVGHVVLSCVPAGMVFQTPMPNQARPQSITDAAKLAWAFAQAESTRVGQPITSARLYGEEFLEKSDVQSMTNNAFPVQLA